MVRSNFRYAINFTLKFLYPEFIITEKNKATLNHRVISESRQSDTISIPIPIPGF